MAPGAPRLRRRPAAPRSMPSLPRRRTVLRRRRPWRGRRHTATRPRCRRSSGSARGVSPRPSSSKPSSRAPVRTIPTPCMPPPTEARRAVAAASATSDGEAGRQSARSEVVRQHVIALNGACSAWIARREIVLTACAPPGRATFGLPACTTPGGGRGAVPVSAIMAGFSYGVAAQLSLHHAAIRACLSRPHTNSTRQSGSKAVMVLPSSNASVGSPVSPAPAVQALRSIEICRDASRRASSCDSSSSLEYTDKSTSAEKATSSRRDLRI